MHKTVVALGLAGLLLAAGSSTGSAAFTVPTAKSVISNINSDLADVRWRRCWLHWNGRESPISGLAAISCPATISRPVTASGCGTIRNRPEAMTRGDIAVVQCLSQEWEPTTPSA
jgi:hypothetical protein